MLQESRWETYWFLCAFLSFTLKNNALLFHCSVKNSRCTSVQCTPPHPHPAHSFFLEWRDYKGYAALQAHLQLCKWASAKKCMKAFRLSGLHFSFTLGFHDLTWSRFIRLCCPCSACYDCSCRWPIQFLLRLMWTYVCLSSADACPVKRACVFLWPVPSVQSKGCIRALIAVCPIDISCSCVCCRLVCPIKGSFSIVRCLLSNQRFVFWSPLSSVQSEVRFLVSVAVAPIRGSLSGICCHLSNHRFVF